MNIEEFNEETRDQGIGIGTVVSVSLKNGREIVGKVVRAYDQSKPSEWIAREGTDGKFVLGIEERDERPATPIPIEDIESIRC